MIIENKKLLRDEIFSLIKKINFAIIRRQYGLNVEISGGIGENSAFRKNLKKTNFSLDNRFCLCNYNNVFLLES